jgi:hypothetical protein
VRVILLGPQRRPTVDAVARSLGLPGGRFVTVTAGWLERERDDGELSALLGGRAVGLELYQRWLDVQERDPEYAAAERALQGVLGELAEAYLLRLDYALQAVYALQRRGGPARAPGGGAAPAGAVAGAVAVAVAEAVGAVRELDAAHLRRVGEARAEFAGRLRPQDRPVIAGHRAAVAGLLGEAAALVIAGGHVGVLAGVLHLFGVAAATASPVIAWSAGAMALADRIVLFHDRSAHGPGHPEVYAAGLGLLRDVVLLPHARTRLLLDDTPRMATFAQRFAPARSVLLEAGARIDVSGDGGYPAGTRVLAADGRVTTLGEAR